MNQRIKTLADIAKTKVPPGLFVERWIERYNEEFARLIIEECTSIELYWLNDQDRKAVMDKIKQHFGVES